MFIILGALIVSAAAIILFWLCRNRYEQYRLTRSLNHHTHKILSDKTLQKALQEADACGLGVAFRDYVQGITKHTGQPYIKVGHLLWIFEQLEAGHCFHAGLPIPKYEREKQSKQT